MDLTEPLCDTDDSNKVVYEEYKFGGSYDFYITYSGDGSETASVDIRVVQVVPEKEPQLFIHYFALFFSSYKNDSE